MSEATKSCPYCFGSFSGRGRYCSREHAKASARHDRSRLLSRDEVARILRKRVTSGPA